jgi:hypothetical protein
MVDPIQNLTIESHPLGSELILRWVHPETLPASYQVIIFRRQGSRVTDEEIENYFTTLTNMDTTLFVMNGISQGSQQIFDNDLENGKIYYFKAVVWNIDTNEYSTAIAGSGTPEFNAQIHALDGKELICQAIKTILSNHNMVRNHHYFLSKAYPLTAPKPPYIIVMRDGDQDAQRLFGNLLSEQEGQLRFGKFAQENFTVIWGDTFSDRRDNMTNIFRAYEHAFSHLFTHQGATEVLTQTQGDSIDTTWENALMHTCSMSIHILSECALEYTDTELKLPFSTVNHV